MGTFELVPGPQLRPVLKVDATPPDAAQGPSPVEAVRDRTAAIRMLQRRIQE